MGGHLSAKNSRRPRKNWKDLSDQELRKLRLENEKLEAVKIQLTQNISSLFATSKKQLQNKEKEINELRKIIDMKQGSYSDKIEYFGYIN